MNALALQLLPMVVGGLRYEPGSMTAKQAGAHSPSANQGDDSSRRAQFLGCAPERLEIQSCHVASLPRACESIKNLGHDCAWNRSWTSRGTSMSTDAQLRFQHLAGGSGGRNGHPPPQRPQTYRSNHCGCGKPRDESKMHPAGAEQRRSRHSLASRQFATLEVLDRF